MTMVDPVTGWFEQWQLYGRTPTAFCHQEILDKVWLALTSSKANQTCFATPYAILERIQQVLQDMLTSADLDNIYIDDDNGDLFNECLTRKKDHMHTIIVWMRHVYACKC